MAKDKYSAVWVSHTSLNDYLKCPRYYYLRNVYKDPKTGHKIQLTGPALALGASVHEVVESLSILPTESRFDESLVVKFDTAWDKFSGKKGGFKDLDQEHQYKERGKAMLRRIMDRPGPLGNKAVKINQELPYYWISEDDNIILCGKIDWLEYLPETDTVNIIDFKTGKNKEEKNSLQLPIYLLLVSNCQKRNVSKASYWYLETDNIPTQVELPETGEAEKQILRIAREIKLAKKLNKFSCPEGESGCAFCRPFESIIKGEGECVGENDYHQDIYILPAKEISEEILDSFIL